MSTERVKQYRLRQKEIGRLKRESYLTDNEWIKVKAYIKQLRDSDKAYALAE